MKQYSHKLGEFEFWGDTKAIARAKAKTCQTETFEGRWSPQVLSYRGVLIIVSRTPGGWSYSSHVMEKGELDRGSSCFGDGSFLETSKDARFALAQRGWTHDDGPDYVPSFVTDPESIASLKTWQAWQIRYKYFAEQGHNRDVCHAMASDSRYTTDGGE